MSRGARSLEHFKQEHESLLRKPEQRGFVGKFNARKKDFGASAAKEGT